MSDDTPTQRMDTPSDSDVHEAIEEEGKKSRGLMIALIAVGALLLIGLIIVLVVLLGRNVTPVALGTTTPTPTVSDTPSQTPTASSTATSTPVATTPTATPKSGGGGSQPTGAAFTSFSAVTQVTCDQGTVNFTPPPIAIQVKWATVRTNSAWIVFGDSDAADSQFMQLPVSGNQSNFPYELDYPCGAASIEVTMTLVGSDGHHLQKHWTIKNNGDKF